MVNLKGLTESFDRMYMVEQNLSQTEGTLSSAIVQNWDAIAQAQSVDEIITMVKEICPPEKIKEPKVRTLLAKLQLAKNLMQANKIIGNFVLAGDGLRAIK